MPVLQQEELERLRQTRGLVATCVLTGTVDPDYAQCREDLRAFNIEHGFRNIEYRNFYCVLVENGRDEVAHHALSQGYDWCLQIDADAAPFHPSALVRLLKRAYIDAPHADAVGAYAQHRQPPYLPTIDTGTGTWEVHYPGEGLLPVTRTGGHFLLTKTSAFQRFGPPWHRTRLKPSPILAVQEFDVVARQTHHGRNPFADSPEWEAIVKFASSSRLGEHSVGEDSGFCDRLLAAGGHIFVDTDVLAGHIMRTPVTPDMLKREMQKNQDARRAAVGIACPN